MTFVDTYVLKTCELFVKKMFSGHSAEHYFGVLASWLAALRAPVLDRKLWFMLLES